MGVEPLKFRKMEPDETFLFHCSRCGECCHDVKGAVLLSSMDLFRIARQRGQQVETVFELFTEIYMIDEHISFPLLMLKTKQHGDACRFYRSGGCAIHEAKPLTCKLYPMGTGPDGKGGLEYILVSQRQRHYTGTQYSAGDWMKKHLTEDDRRFTLLWADLASEMGRLMRKIISLPGGEAMQNSICIRIIWFLYLCYDIDREFWPQFERNMVLLSREMKDAARG